jgi:hypothetical protein
MKTFIRVTAFHSPLFGFRDIKQPWEGSQTGCVHTPTLRNLLNKQNIQTALIAFVAV